jgi:membrane protease YdiL (CAAX protease family)
VLKVWFYAGIVVATGAWISPIAYGAGKALGEVSSVKRTNGFLEWLGRICQEAEFSVFFLVSIIGMALLLFIPFAEWLSMNREPRGKEIGQPLVHRRRAVLEWGTGLLLAAGFFLLIGYGLVATGSFVWVGPPKEPLKLIQGGLPWMLLVVVIQEWLFRGVALGIFLRAFKAGAAISMTAVLFTAVVLLYPSGEMETLDPDASGVGFELLKQMVRRMTEPGFLVGNVLLLLAAGWVLGYARWRTASLWLPIGLQMGWILANVLFQSSTKPVPRVDPLARLMAGDSLMNGFIPLAGVLVVGALVYFVTDSKEETLDGDA